MNKSDNRLRGYLNPFIGMLAGLQYRAIIAKRFQY